MSKIYEINRKDFNGQYYGQRRGPIKTRYDEHIENTVIIKNLV